jgi:hypothetical protein
MERAGPAVDSIRATGQCADLKEAKSDYDER